MTVKTALASSHCLFNLKYSSDLPFYRRHTCLWRSRSLNCGESDFSWCLSRRHSNDHVMKLMLLLNLRPYIDGHVLSFGYFCFHLFSFRLFVLCGQLCFDSIFCFPDTQRGSIWMSFITFRFCPRTVWF